MSRWDKIDVSGVGRPVLRPGERDIVVESNVGIYEGKYKAIGYQKGRVYLTTQRLCYVDDVNPRTNSIGLRLSIVGKLEYTSGFLRTSPKITLFLSEDEADEPVTPPNVAVSWVCPICFFSNELPRDYSNGSSELPVCLTCGIKAQPDVIEKALHDAAGPVLPSASTSATSLTASLASASLAPSRASSVGPSIASSPSGPNDSQNAPVSSNGFECPRCTFINHPSLNQCEMCGARLVSPRLPPGLERADSPGPTTFLNPAKGSDVDVNIVKLSFRGNGDKSFYTALKKAVASAKESAQPSHTATPELTLTTASPAPEPVTGLHGLEMVGERSRQMRQDVLGPALEDLNGLMSRARELVQLAEQYARHLEKEEAKGAVSLDDSSSLAARRALRQSSRALGLNSTIVTKEMSHDQEVFHAELARQVAEFLTGNEELLAREGGVMSLFDLFAVYNRARGISLVSPKDLFAACDLFESLRLPIRLRKFKSGLCVVEEAYKTPQLVARQLADWLDNLETTQPWQAEIGISAQDASTKFGWSLTVALEEIQAAETIGVLCRDEQLSGVRFFKNRFAELTVAIATDD